MKKTRLHRWRWLLALLLGAGAWWGVGWCLSPKPHLVLTRSAIPATEKSEPTKHQDEPEIEVLGERHVIVHRASILDAAGRYLLIKEISSPRTRHYEVIDLQTRQVVARHAFAERLHISIEEDHEHVSNSLGVKHVIFHEFEPYPIVVPEIKIIQQGKVTFEVLEDGPIIRGSPPTAPQLWEWNVFKNEQRLLRKFSQHTVLKISHNGSTLLEIERITPLMPSLLLPGSLPQALAGLAMNEVGGNDVAILQVRSLPSLEKRFSLAFPWVEREYAAELSSDGRYIIIPDATLMHGFTSPTRITSNDYHNLVQGGRGFITSREYYASYPLGIRIYDTHSNELWWDSSKLPGVYCRCTPEHSLVRFKADDDGNSVKSPELLLHLPTRTVLRPLASNSMAPLTETIMQFDSINIKEDDVTQEIQAIDQNGQMQTLATINAQGLQLIPHATQYLLEAERSPRFLDMLAEWLHARQWFTDWQPRVTWEIKMMDYWKQRTLWAERFQHRPVATIAYPWLLVSHNDGERFHLSVYALPFSSWSPWWARIAGLIVCIFVHYLVRQRRTKANDVPSLPKTAY